MPQSSQIANTATPSWLGWRQATKALSDFEPVRLTVGDQPVERAIDGLRGERGFVAQAVDELVSAYGPADAAQSLDDHLVLLRRGTPLRAFANHVHRCMPKACRRRGGGQKRLRDN